MLSSWSILIVWTSVAENPNVIITRVMWLRGLALIAHHPFFKVHNF
jgi:hypothetical protein